MAMAEALAVVLLLNGVQVDLPRPALMIGGVACVPLRAVCERVGGQVRPEPGSVVVVTGRGAIRFGLATGSAPKADDAAVQVAGVAYVRAKALARAMGGACTWSPQQRTADLHLPWLGKAPVAASREAIAKDALAWRGRLVEVSGRHGGRLTDPLGPAVSVLPPGEDTFVLGGPWAIYCSSQEFGAAAPVPPPLSMIGRPVRVTAVVVLGPRGTALLKPVEIEMAPGDRATALRVTSDRLRFGAGETGYVGLTTGGTETRTGLRRVGPRRSRVQIEAPDGGTASIGIEKLALRAGSTDTIGAWGLQGTGIWTAPGGPGRQGQGMWRARVTVGSGTEPAECAFLVHHSSSAAESGHGE